MRPRSSTSSQTQIYTLLTDIQIRDEVQTTLSEVLAIVETEHYVNLVFRYESQVMHLKHQVSVLDDEVAEWRAMSVAEQQQRCYLADKLVGELWALSVKLERMEEWEKENGHKVEKYNELQAELKRQEEKVRSLKRQASLSQNANVDPRALNETEDSIEGKPATAASLSAAMTALIEEEQSQTMTNFRKHVPQDTARVSDLDDEKERVAPVNVESDEGVDQIDILDSSDVQTTAPSIGNENEQNKRNNDHSKEDLPNLKSLSEQTLLDIFSFLEAFDVLNCAQVDKEFYSRVDVLFGIGSSVVNTVSPRSPTTPDESKHITNNESKEIKKVHKDVYKDVPSVTELNGTSSSSSSPSKVGASILASFVTSPNSDQTLSLQSRPLLSYVSSIVQKQTQKVPNSSSTQKSTSSENTSSPTAISRNHTRTSSVSIDTAQTGGLTATMADSMADKLTPAELSVIIVMTEKLRQREKDVKRVTSEREDLAARLDGSEAVKDFLIGKVQKTETTLKKCNDEAVLVQQQTASDQEVIAFLDGRVQELEKIGKETADKKSKLEKLLLQTKEQNEKRNRVLEDMLQFERQQLAEQEKEFKATKKVLVKEVKHCHAQIAALKAERDSFQQQNQQLKQHLLKRNGTKTR